MGFDANGNVIPIDAVVINTHARPEELLNGEETWSLRTTDIQTLYEKDMGTLFLFGCNAGHLDYEDINVASAFAGKVNDAPVLASDGTVYHKNGGDYKSKNDKVFKEWRKTVNPTSKRENEGWLVYQQTESGLEISESQGKKLYFSNLLQVGNDYRLLRCE